MNDFGGLLEKQIPRVRRYARPLIRGVSRAEDLFEDAIVRTIAKRHFWQRDSNLRAWLSRAAGLLSVGWREFDVDSDRLAAVPLTEARQAIGKIFERGVLCQQK